MSRRYDTRTTIFSPKGRLFQVEYAMEAINYAGTCVGVTYDNGVILGSEKRNIDKLLDTFLPEKIYKVSDVAGVTSDATTLINHMRIISEKHFKKFQDSMTVEQLVREICNLKQQYTQIGGYRPFGVSLLYAGWDSHHGFQLFQSDPSGNYNGWKATCIGKSNEEGVSLLKTEFVESMSYEAALKLVVNVLFKTVEKKPLSSENVEIAYITQIDGKIAYHMLSPIDIDSAIEAAGYSRPTATQATESQS